MKRFYFVLVIIVFAALAILPFVYGVLFKNQFNDIVAVVNKNDVIQVNIMQYKQGWMKSSATIKIEPGKQAQNNAKIKALVDTGQAGFTLNLKISHGPIIWNAIHHRLSFAYGSINGYLSLPAQIEGFIFGKKQADGFMQFNIISGLGGNWFSEYKSPATILPGPTGVSARWDGMNAIINASVENEIVNKYYSKLLFDAFVISPNGNPPGIPHVNIQPITYEGSMNNADVANQKIIKGAFLVPSIVIDNPTPVLTITNLRQNQTTLLDSSKNTLDFSTDVSWDQIAVPSFLPTTLTKSSVFINVKNINQKEFFDVMQYTRSIKRQMTPEELSQLQGMLPKMISPTSQLSLDIGMTTPEGVLILNTKLNWPDTLPASATLPVLMQAATATAAIRVSSDVLMMLINRLGFNLPVPGKTPIAATSVPVSETPADLPAPGAVVDPTETTAAVTTPTPPVATDAASMLQYYVDKGYLIKDNKDYVTVLSYSKGVLVANGHQVGQ